ncbi:distal tail protein Dit [Clostridium botulinum]|uniref:distal tail protein Dit n=1 Tax=Clostridium botulinum TaxID=1491 RepID=UPI000774B048|nr:distal tail protein Dit [Clostridium botulinum]NFE93717.1 phage tail protein [Clostridium botulinum]NFL38467.1 phage tail protein [Clostridium botulinum]NFN08304.1 phage tail protein [Clostridium botulinum]NFN31482.1 phage tail protein [Clostridium botulinum]NFN68530.1 phage tail protein [Clostridium botulinum]
MSYSIIFNKICNLDLDIDIIKRPIIPFPTKRISPKEVPGKDGCYYVDEGTYEDMIIPIEFNFIENDLDNIKPKVRNIKKWIDNIDDEKLILSDDPDMFYKVCKVELSNIEYEDLYEIQKFTVSFTVNPYQYTLKGQKQIELKNILFNHYDTSKPIYIVVGNGNCTFKINDAVINCKVNNKLIINTEFDKILESDGSFAIGKTNIKYMQNLYITHGKNTFSWSSGFKVYIITNLRTI